jgi:hypothetical protein
VEIAFIIGNFMVAGLVVIARQRNDRFGIAGRNRRTTLLVTAADGMQYLTTFGGGFGEKGKSSHREQQRSAVLAGINNAALKAASEPAPE